MIQQFDGMGSFEPKIQFKGKNELFGQIMDIFDPFSFSLWKTNPIGLQCDIHMTFNNFR